MVPPRGQIVSSRPRQWLTLRELQTAFLAGRLRLNEAEVNKLVLLVKAFAMNEIQNKKHAKTFEHFKLD